MKRRFLLATLTATAACCLALGLSACTKAAEPEPRGITVSAAYTLATELGYEGTNAEFGYAVVDNAEKTIVNVYKNANGEIIVEYSDGTTQNLGRPSHTHSYGNWRLEATVTCTSDGRYTRTCSVCGDIDYKFIKAKGHTPYFITHSQSLHIYECKNCNEIISAEHDFDENDVCGFCNYKADYTLGLTYVISDDRASYEVSATNKSERVDVIIPSEYRGLPVTGIRMNGFTSCLNLKSIAIPESVTKINNMAFANCQQLTEIALPQTLKSIGNSVFYRCTALEGLEIPESVTEVGTYIFRHCSGLKKINLPKSWTSVPTGMYAFCTGLESFELPENITSIGSNAFLNCAVTSVTIPETVTEIAAGAFNRCKNLETVNLHDKLTAIGAGAFGNCEGLKEIELPNSLENLGNLAFENCTSLTKISLPAGNTEYGINIFKGCTALESVTLNEGFAKIPEGMFSRCENLTKLVIPNSVTLIEVRALLNTSALTEITYNGTMAEWKAVQKESGWKTTDIIITDLTIRCTDGVLEYIW